MDLWRVMNAYKQEIKPTGIDYSNLDSIAHAQQQIMADENATTLATAVDLYKSKALENIFSSYWNLANIDQILLLRQVQQQSQVQSQVQSHVTLEPGAPEPLEIIPDLQAYINAAGEIVYLASVFDITLPDYRKLRKPPHAQKPKSLIYKDKKFKTYGDLIAFQRRHEAELKKIRFDAASVDVGSLDNARSSSYSLFGESFNFASFPVAAKNETPYSMTEYEYDLMRKDFAINGDDERVVVKTETDFPPLQFSLEQQKKLCEQFACLTVFNALRNPDPMFDRYFGDGEPKFPLFVKKRYPYCVFCINNKQSPEMYNNHVIKDDLDRVICPVLRSYTCPICGSSGETAHTKQHCPHRFQNIHRNSVMFKNQIQKKRQGYLKKNFRVKN